MSRARCELFIRGLILIGLPLAVACERPAAEEAEAGADSAAAAAPARPEEADLTALRTKFEPAQNFASAAGMGYSEAITSCWFNSREAGAQVIHYARSQLIDSVVTVMDPEILMYEPQQGGAQSLVGVEYIVPFAQWTSANPPMVLGQAMHRNEALSLWVLHAWLWRDNPKGIYADWNPNVSCTNALQSEDRAAPAP